MTPAEVARTTHRSKTQWRRPLSFSRRTLQLLGISDRCYRVQASTSTDATDWIGKFDCIPGRNCKWSEDRTSDPELLLLQVSIAVSPIYAPEKSNLAIRDSQTHFSTMGRDNLLLYGRAAFARIFLALDAPSQIPILAQLDSDQRNTMSSHG